MTAREPGLALPVTGLVAQLFIAARAQGLGSLDHSALFKWWPGLSRPPARSRPASPGRALAGALPGAVQKVGSFT